MCTVGSRQGQGPSRSPQATATCWLLSAAVPGVSDLALGHVDQVGIRHLVGMGAQQEPQAYVGRSAPALSQASCEDVRNVFPRAANFLPKCQHGLPVPTDSHTPTLHPSSQSKQGVQSVVPRPASQCLLGIERQVPAHSALQGTPMSHVPRSLNLCSRGARPTRHRAGPSLISGPPSPFLTACAQPVYLTPLPQNPSRPTHQGRDDRPPWPTFLSLTHWLRDYKMVSDLRLSRKAGACPDSLATYTGYETTPHRTDVRKSTCSDRAPGTTHACGASWPRPAAPPSRGRPGPPARKARSLTPSFLCLLRDELLQPGP